MSAGDFTTASVGDLSAFDALPSEQREMVERIVAYRIATAWDEGFEMGLAVCGRHSDQCAVHYPIDGVCDCRYGALRSARPTSAGSPQ